MKQLAKTVQYTFTLPSMLHNRLAHHLRALTHLKHPERKRQTWLFNAIHEKIQRDKHSQDILKAKYLNIRLNHETMKKLKNRFLEINSRGKLTYSKKQWMLDAIHEKMESENELVQKKLAEHASATKSII